MCARNKEDRQSARKAMLCSQEKLYVSQEKVLSDQQWSRKESARVRTSMGLQGQEAKAVHTSSLGNGRTHSYGGLSLGPASGLFPSHTLIDFACMQKSLSPQTLSLELKCSSRAEKIKTDTGIFARA